MTIPVDQSQILIGAQRPVCVVIASGGLPERRVKSTITEGAQALASGGVLVPRSPQFLHQKPVL
jgi:hypothetical protein